MFRKNPTDNDRVTETYQFRNGYAGAPTPRGYAAYTPLRTLGVQVEARF